LYKRLMQESDNFIAEQLLLLCSATISDTLNTEKAIKYASAHFLQDLPDKPLWKDGSGLSRYNLFTPRSIISLLEKLYAEVPRQRLFDIFPAGGQSGTIKKWYASDNGQPYIFAKTGTLSNVHCLSGYLITQKGKVLLFSFMHNNYVVDIDEVRKEMQKVLKELYLKY
jgi:serine-type D-Ala-D-Ala carboxypeptidase/endopeptidase (penicillin-binding protein 4)